MATTVRGTEIDVDRLFDAAELKCEMRLVARFMGFARVGFTLPASYDLKAAAAAPEERATFDVQRFVRDIRVGAPEADGLNLEVNMKHFNTTVLSLRKALVPFRDTLEAADLEVRGTRPEVSFSALADGVANIVLEDDLSARRVAVSEFIQGRIWHWPENLRKIEGPAAERCTCFLGLLALPLRRRRCLGRV